MARYKSVLANSQPWTHVQFTEPARDRVGTRDYSLKTSRDLHQYAGRSGPRPPCDTRDRAVFRWPLAVGDRPSSAPLGTLVAPCADDPSDGRDRSGPDASGGRSGHGHQLFRNGLRFCGPDPVFPGRYRAHVKKLRQTLQHRQTPSARQRDRYTAVAWAFDPLCQILAYLAAWHHVRPVAVNPGRPVRRAAPSREVIATSGSTASNVNTASTDRKMIDWRLELAPSGNRAPGDRCECGRPAVVRVLSTPLRCDPISRKETAIAIVCPSGVSHAPAFRPAEVDMFLPPLKV